MKAYVYINPKAPAEVKELLTEHFSDVSTVSSIFMQEVTGGFEDEGPALAEYAAVLLDEEGEYPSSGASNPMKSNCCACRQR